MIMTPTNDAPAPVEALARAAADAYAAFVIAREQMNAAIPSFRATPAERQLHIERSRIDHEAEREHHRTAIALAQNAHRLAALASAPAGDGVGLWEALTQARQYVERKSCDAFDDREDKLLAVIDAALARPRAAVGEREHFLAATTARSWMHHAATCPAVQPKRTDDGYRTDCTCGLDAVLRTFDRDVLGMVTIPLQSPPAKVEG